jgi:hypothetical protein
MADAIVRDSSPPAPPHGGAGRGDAAGKMCFLVSIRQDKRDVIVVGLKVSLPYIS